ncbi:MAG: UDP-2,3-diacylglucosamine diphosphatase [Chitinophagales bacterium]|nr:UDP-2,3-diacylglucosamine diphosphatase [Chitinophagales bacterium]
MQPREIDVLVISDVHLGTYGCNAAELNEYLRSVKPKTLVLNGDIIDIWQFNKNYWPKEHMETIQIFLDFLKQGVTVYYVTGNHDELMRKFSGFIMGNLHLVDKVVLNLDGKRAWIFHGDVFDFSVNYGKWIAKFAGKSYDQIIKVNRFINFLLVKMGRERVSLSKRIKNSVKRAVKFVSDYEMVAAQHAIDQGYDYVICGHIHQPQQKVFTNGKGSVTYLNSGDWIENLTALEYHNGEWKLYSHIDELVHSLDEIFLPNDLPKVPTGAENLAYL